MLTQLLIAPSPPRLLAEAMTRALAAAAVVGGVMAELPCRFHLVDAPGGTWIVVGCPADADPARAAFVQERTLTAVQRLTLALWSEGVEAVWEAAPLPGEALLPEDLGAHAVIGRVWCPGASEPPLLVTAEAA